LYYLDLNNSYSVLLYDTKTSEKNISQILIELGHASETVKGSSIGCDTYFKIQEEETGFITSVTSYSDFWVQLARNSEQLDQLMVQLNEIYSQMNTSDLQMISPIIGQYCCSCFTGDDGWYRACIEEVDGKSMTVKYIDYGNSEHLNIDRVKVLNTDFDGTPRFALPCKLENHEQLKSIDSATSVLLDQEFTIQFKSKEAPFTVEILVNGTPLSKTLLEKMGTKTAIEKPGSTKPVSSKSAEVKQTNGHAFTSSIKSIVESVKIGESKEMFFLEASSPHEFYCQPVATEKDLATLMEDISTYVASEKTHQFKGRVGDFALAIYKEDGGWYRVLLLEKLKQSVCYILVYCFNTQSCHLRLFLVKFNY